MLRLVLGVGAVMAPLAGPVLRRRLARGKEDPARVTEKQGHARAPRPDGPLIWLHGVGLGEVMALRGLIAHLAEARPDLSFLVTSSARSSGAVFAANLPPRTQHHYLPLDFPAPVARFLDHWRPDLAVWSDQEVWPRLAVTCARRGIPQAYVAARITDASAKARARFGRAYGDLYGLMDVIHAQEDRTAGHLRDMIGAAAQVTVSGSLKSASAPLADDPAARAAFAGAVAGRSVWVVASSNAVDEALAVEAHAPNRVADPDRLLVIVPRDVTRGADIMEALAQDGLTAVRRSTGALPRPDTAVYVADTFGELGIWYRHAEAALIGGTFDAVQGHNPWEAAALGCAILHGPNVANFASDFKALDEADAARQVHNAAEVRAALRDASLPQMASRAAQVRARAAQNLQATAQDLLRLMAV